jgi:hypothetical protein
MKRNLFDAGAQLRLSRTKPGRFGEEVLFDAFPGDWFGGRGQNCYLLLAIDVATGGLSLASLTPLLDVWCFFDTVARYIYQYGRPGAFLTDYSVALRRGEGALRRLDINLPRAPLVPSVKGLAERAYLRLRDGRRDEVRRRPVSSFAEADDCLTELTRRYNGLYPSPHARDSDAHRPLPPGVVLEEALLPTVVRRVFRSAVRYRGMFLTLSPLRTDVEGELVTVVEDRRGDVFIEHQGERLEYTQSGAGSCVDRAGDLSGPAEPYARKPTRLGRGRPAHDQK